MGFFKWISRKNNNKNSYSLKESGNVFLMLFGAVGMVGVIGASTMTVMKGPVRTMAQVTKQTLTENEMIAAGKLALISATQNGGNCDTDTTVEPLPMSSNVIAGFTGGSEIPTQIGTSKEDSWGMRYGYCAWDHGSDVGQGTCAGLSYRAGTDSGDQYVIAIVSAGPDGVFQTSCNDFVDVDGTPGADVALVDRPGGSDDLFLGYTYSEAAAASGGLWNEDGANEATIARDVTIQDSSGVDQFAFNATSGELTLGGGIPNLNTDFIDSMANSVIEFLKPINSASNITTTENISGADLAASGTLGVTGTSTLGAVNAGATGVTTLTASGAVTGGSLSTGGTLGVTGTSTLGVLNAGVTGVASLTSGGDLTVNGNSILGNELTDTVAIAGNTTMAGTLGVTGNTGLSTLGTSGLATLESLTVTNATNLNGNITLGDTGTDSLTINALIANDLNLNTNKITNLATPTVAADAATKAYVDSQVASGAGFTEADPQVGDLGAGTAGMNWCTSNGSEITCTAPTPSEDDPQVGDIATSGQWCRSNGTEIICDLNDPTVAGQGDNLGDHTATQGIIFFKVAGAAAPTK